MSGAPGSSFWMATLAASVEHSGGGGGGRFRDSAVVDFQQKGGWECDGC